MTNIYLCNCVFFCKSNLSWQGHTIHQIKGILMQLFIFSYIYYIVVLSWNLTCCDSALHVTLFPMKHVSTLSWSPNLDDTSHSWAISLERRRWLSASRRWSEIAWCANHLALCFTNAPVNSRWPAKISHCCDLHSAITSCYIWAHSSFIHPRANAGPLNKAEHF